MTGYKKNYTRGSRNELIRHILSVGLVTSNGLAVMEGSQLSLQRTLTKMKKEGIVENVFVGRGVKAAYIVSINEKGEEYLDQIPLGYYRHYNSICGNISKRLKKKEEKGEMERVVRIGDAFSFMKGAGIKCYWDEKPRILKEDEWKERPRGVYYSSLEVKANSGNVATWHLPASRSVGVLCGEDKCYPVFLAKDKLLKWNGVTEESYLMYLKQKEEKWGFDAGEGGEECIVIAHREDTIEKMMFPDKEKLKNFLPTLFTREQSVYEKIYAVPYVKEAQTLIRRMTEKGWEEKIRKEVLGEYFRPKTIVTCDAIKDDTHIFVFCVPDIRRFAKFVIAARDTGNASKFKTICYDWQADIVKKLLTPDECRIEIIEGGIKT